MTAICPQCVHMVDQGEDHNTCASDGKIDPPTGNRISNDACHFKNEYGDCRDFVALEDCCSECLRPHEVD